MKKTTTFALCFTLVLLASAPVQARPLTFRDMVRDAVAAILRVKPRPVAPKPTVSQKCRGTVDPNGICVP